MAKKYVGVKPLELEIYNKTYKVNYQSSTSLEAMAQISKICGGTDDVSAIRKSEEMSRVFLDATLGDGAYEEISKCSCSTLECVRIVSFVFDAINEDLGGAVDEYIN